MSTHFPLPTSHFPLPTSHFPLSTFHFRRLKRRDSKKKKRRNTTRFEEATGYLKWIQKKEHFFGPKSGHIAQLYFFLKGIFLTHVTNSLAHLSSFLCPAGEQPCKPANKAVSYKSIINSSITSLRGP